MRAAFKALATGSLTLRWVFQEFIQKNLFLNFVSVLLHLFIFSIGVHRILPTPAVASEGTLCLLGCEALFVSLLSRENILRNFPTVSSSPGAFSLR